MYPIALLSHRQIMMINIDSTHSRTYRMSSGEDLTAMATMTGPMGVGKGWMLNRLKALETFPESLQILSFGDMLAKLANVDRDQLRTLSPKLISELQPRVANYARSQAPLIFDSHVVAIQDGALLHNPAAEKIMRPAHYVAVVAEPELIVARRAQDESRVRVLQTADEINTHQKVMLAILSVLSDELGSGVTVLRNEPGNEALNLALLMNLLREERIWPE